MIKTSEHTFKVRHLLTEDWDLKLISLKGKPTFLIYDFESMSLEEIKENMYSNNNNDYLWVMLQDLGRVKEVLPLKVSVLVKDTKKNLRSYPWQKYVYWRRNWKNISSERWVRLREAPVPEWWGRGVSRQGLYIFI